MKTESPIESEQKPQNGLKKKKNKDLTLAFFLWACYL